MRITGIHAKDVMPIRRFGVDGLSNVVVLAGPNGVGKTRLLEWLIAFLRNIRPDPDQWITVEATYNYERDSWGKSALDTRDSNDAKRLTQTLQRNRKRADQRSTILNFESDRSIAQIKPYAFTWESFDPFDEEVGWDVGLSYLKNRFQDTQHSIFRKIRNRRESIATDAEKLFGELSKPSTDAFIQLKPKDYPDPLAPFKEAFSQLLAPKELVEADLTNQTLLYSDGSAQRPLAALSSGEREVVNIVFDFILRNPSDCVVIFDEPELHLHPELSYKLIQTLKGVGARNQFIFCTHSADIISASLENSVVFVTAPKEGADDNQAIVVREDDETHQALKLVGQSIGIVALGRRIVLIEGEHSSLDKQTYGAILRNRFPNLVLVPSGGRATLESFSQIQEKVLNHAVWGVDFFMLCDGDVTPPSGGAADRLRALPRYHLENYFLDEAIIAQVFAPLEPADSWLRDSTAIQSKLQQIAQEFVSYAVALIVSSKFRELAGNLDIMASSVHSKSAVELADVIANKAESERRRLNSVIDIDTLKLAIEETFNELTQSFNDGAAKWKRRIPGRPILGKFCSSLYANMDAGRFKTAYLAAAKEAPADPFSEIVEIFEGFSSYKLA